MLGLVRYELAQQLQPQPTEDPLGAAAVAHDMQVEIEGDSLPQTSASSGEQQSLLGLGQAEVVNGGQQVTLEATLTDKRLVQEGKQVSGLCFIVNANYYLAPASKSRELFLLRPFVYLSSR